MLKDLVERTFATRNLVQLQHWKTDSGFHHQVLGEFYEELITLLDRFVEAQLGAVGGAAELPPSAEDVVKILQDEMIWITEKRTELAHGVPALENILDELAGAHMRAVFKLKQMR